MCIIVSVYCVHLLNLLIVPKGREMLGWLALCRLYQNGFVTILKILDAAWTQRLCSSHKKKEMWNVSTTMNNYLLGNMLHLYVAPTYTYYIKE